MIAETENHHVAAWQRTLSFMGWQVPDEVAARAAEVDDREFLAELFAARGIPVDKVDEWVRRKQELTVQLLRDVAAALSGVVELVRGLPRQGAAGGGFRHLRENIQAVLDAAGVADAFDAIVAKEDVTHGKPGAGGLSAARSRGSGCRRGRRWRSRTRPPGWRRPAPRASAVIAVGHRRPFGDWVGDATYI